MKSRYDFSKAIRGKFYRPNLRLNVPIYLDEDVAPWLEKYAKRKKVDVQTVVNDMLRHNKDLSQSLR